MLKSLISRKNSAGVKQMSTNKKMFRATYTKCLRGDLWLETSDIGSSF